MKMRSVSLHATAILSLFCFIRLYTSIDVVAITHSGQTCSHSYFGRGCRLKCNCEDISDCHRVRGGCKTCVQPYTDSAYFCQRLNAAQSRPTLQSFSVSTSESGRAVDGNLGTCSRSSDYQWWQVDLQTVHEIKWVDVHNGPSDRPAARFNSYNVYVANTPLTIDFNGSLPRSGDKHCKTTETRNAYIVCPFAIKGRYVIITNNYPKIISLCEVEVHVCANYTFGEDCKHDCNCHNDTEICNRITGQCGSGCRAGFMGTDCHTKCADGKFGVGCEGLCNCKSWDDVCSKIDGQCPSGCANGFTGVGCDKKIELKDGSTAPKMLAAVIGLSVVTAVLLIAMSLVGVVFVVRKYARSSRNKSDIDINTYAQTNHVTDRYSDNEYDEVANHPPRRVWSTTTSEHVNNVEGGWTIPIIKRDYYEENPETNGYSPPSYQILEPQTDAKYTDIRPTVVSPTTIADDKDTGINPNSIPMYLTVLPDDSPERAFITDHPPLRDPETTRL